MRTIFAPATPAGRSGVAIIRISGSHASHCLSALGVQRILKPREATYVTLTHPQDQHIIDNVLLLWFPAPNSFTGEDTLEIHHHGSLAVRNDLIHALSLIPHFYFAEAGEFARQAFHNNKLDLTEVEGLSDLLEAETLLQKKQALRQMNGELSDFCSEIRLDIIKAKAFVEAYIDFPDEEIPESTIVTLHNEIHEIRRKIEQTLNDNHYGEKVREGFVGVILGEPNTGKSTLINTLSKRDAAIVSDIAGTTRDLLEVHLHINGASVTLIDTAGIRDNPDVIEAEGIRRALVKAENADFILYLCHVTETDKTTIFNIAEDIPIVKILSKSDLLPQDMVFHVKHEYDIVLSAHTNTGIQDIVNRIETLISQKNNTSTQPPLITRARHRQAFEQAKQHLDAFFEQTDIMLQAEELNLAMNLIASVSGTINIDEIYDLLFGSFCIGK
jgi:tRNA modification GTPase